MDIECFQIAKMPSDTFDILNKMQLFKLYQVFCWNNERHMYVMRLKQKDNNTICLITILIELQ